MKNPKEEPKQDSAKERAKNYMRLKNGYKDKDYPINTPYEAAETAWQDYEHKVGNLYSSSFKDGFVLGVKWNSEKIMEFIEKLQQRQVEYENQAIKADSEHTTKKFTYKAIATRDCWKELFKMIQDGETE